MPTVIQTVTIDCADVARVADFWAEVLGYVEDPDDPNLPDEPAWLLMPPDGNGTVLLFLPVPEAKTVKNRLHLDLRPDGPRDVEVERVLALGATMVDDRRTPDGAGWAVLADPEGNEFCIVRSAAERAD